MKDFLGQHVDVGDVIITLIKGYRSLTYATVISITPKTVLVEFNYSDNWKRTYRVDGSQFIIHKKSHENQND